MTQYHLNNQLVMIWTQYFIVDISEDLMKTSVLALIVLNYSLKQIVDKLSIWKSALYANLFGIQTTLFVLYATEAHSATK